MAIHTHSGTKMTIYSYIYSIDKEYIRRKK